MIAAPCLTAASIAAIEGVAHGFFGRAGGVSRGIYATLNTGLGTDDDPAAVAENRARCAQSLGVAPDHLLTLYQIHSARVVEVDKPWDRQGPRADGMVTRREGVALGILAADCMPFLFVDPKARVVGAAHAGWRGALAGILEATTAEMVRLGAEPGRIVAALGPCLRRENFEVGPDVLDAFLAQHPDAERFFSPGVRPDRRQLDLAAFGRARLNACGVTHVDDLGVCTLGQNDAWFSYRGSRRAGQADYGRNLSAVALSPS
jgi:hypothetical protein